jgi:hypothetical protein
VRFHAEIERFEEWLRCGGLVEKEQFLGAYYDRREGGPEGDLVVS